MVLKSRKSEKRRLQPLEKPEKWLYNTDVEVEYMLLNFKMKNVYSYNNTVEFSMLAPANRVKSRYEDNYINVCGYDVLKTAIIVGENAGGKSNFIRGLQYFLNDG